MADRYPITAGDLNIYHARLIADQQVTYVVEFSQSLEIDRLNGALAVLHGALPILGTTLLIKGTSFHRVPIPDFQPALSFIYDPADRQQEIARFIGMPCDPECQPPLKLLIIRDRGEDTLCFKVDHVLTDAAGLRFLLSLFAEAYSSGRITQEINADRDFGQLYHWFSPVSLMENVVNARFPSPGPVLIEGQASGGEQFVEHTCLQPAEFEILRHTAKNANATINDVLLASLYQTVFKVLPPAKLEDYPVMVPVDMRRYLPVEKQGVIGNLSSAIYPRLDRIDDEPFNDTLVRVKNVMDKFKREKPGLGIMIFMTFGGLGGGRLFRDTYRKAAGRGSRFINFTNFGIIDPACREFQKVAINQAYGVGPIQLGRGILIAITTYQNKLHLVAQGKGTDAYRTFTHNFLESILYPFR